MEKIKLMESSTTLIEETQKEKEKKLYEEIENLKTEKNQFQIILKTDNDQKEILIEELKKTISENENKIALISNEK